MSGNVSWQLNGHHASLLCGTLRAAVDARKPSLGVHDASLNERRLECCEFLCLAIDAAIPGALVDLYHRGPDLIARYAQTADRPFAVLAYWRAALTGAYPYVDLIVSVETSLLDSHPQLDVQTSLALTSHDVQRSDKRPCCVARFTAAGVSYVEIRHPDDALSSVVTNNDGQARLTTHLFGQPLEKGVILRSRLRGVFLPRHDEEALADAALAEFVAAPPPLTT